MRLWRDCHRDRRTVLRATNDLHGPCACAVIVDRLTFNGHLIETGTTSYHLAHTCTQRPQRGAN